MATVAQVRSRLGSSVRLTAARIVRHAAVVGIAGALSGVIVGGVGGRVVMRIAAVAAPDRAIGRRTEAGATVGAITFDGTFFLVIAIGLIAGGVGAVLFLISEPWLARLGRFRGPVFGLFLLLIGSTAFNVLNPDNFDFILVRNQELVVAMFVALFILFGVLIAPLATFLDRRLPDVRPERMLRTTGPYLALTLFGLLFVNLLVRLYTNEQTCGCDPRYAVGGLLLAMTVATLFVWFAPFYGGGRPWWGAGVIGYLSFAGAAIVGGSQAVRDIVEIV